VDSGPITMVDQSSKTGGISVQELLSPTPSPETPGKVEHDTPHESVELRTPSPLPSAPTPRTALPAASVNSHLRNEVCDVEDYYADSEEDLKSTDSVEISLKYSRSPQKSQNPSPENWVVMPPKINGRRPKPQDVRMKDPIPIKHANTSKHIPRRPRRERAIELGFDREPARYLKLEPSKLVMDFQTEKEHPAGSGVFDPAKGTTVLNRFAYPVNFADRKSITKLNQWRSQIISRNFAPVHKKREYWLKSEKQQVLDLIEARYAVSTQIHWTTLTNTFNTTNNGTIQPAGSEFLNKGTRLARKLASDRLAPWRTSASIQHAALKWPEYTKLSNARREETVANADLLDDGKEEAEESSSEDEDEIPDPNPEPPTYAEAQALRKKKAKEDRIRRKSLETEKAKETTPKSSMQKGNKMVTPKNIKVKDTEISSVLSDSKSCGSSISSQDSTESESSWQSGSSDGKFSPSPQPWTSSSPTNANGKRTTGPSGISHVSLSKRMKTWGVASFSDLLRPGPGFIGVSPETSQNDTENYTVTTTTVEKKVVEKITIEVEASEEENDGEEV
jgi:hypothetical protein